MVDERIYANGINALTGDYLVAPLETSQVAALARDAPRDDAQDKWLAKVSGEKSRKTLGVPFNVDADDPASAGWGIVFPSEGSADLQLALQTLIEHRTAKLGAAKVKVLFHQPNEGWADWLRRHGVGPGTINPAKVPYYLLLVGPPTQISFEMQYLLDVEYAVGRLHLDDLDAYRRYASTVVEYESASGAARDASAAFFGTRHPRDPATALSADLLIDPLAKAFAPGGQFAASIPDVKVHTSLGAGSSKASLADLFRGTGPMGRPALFFSATHGLGGFPAGHPDQPAKQGALLCQDWPGLGSVSPDHYFAASDLPLDAQVRGLVAFFFACYGAGTPDVDPYLHEPGKPAATVAPEAFVAALPKALLSHPNGGALAAVGHIDRAWGFSFLSMASQPLLNPFQNAIGWILLGKPIGYAMKDFNEKYAVHSAGLSALIENVGWGKAVPDQQLAIEWLQRNDAQNYIILGDPAVRLMHGIAEA